MSDFDWMQKKLLYLLLLYGCISHAQTCPRVTFPANGAVDVPVDVTITWPKVEGIVGYLISLGTTPGGIEILNRRSAGLDNSFTPPVGLPDNTEIYVTISIFLTDQPLLICPGESFRTVDVTTPPACTQLSDPTIGDVVSVGNITWDYAPTATGYILYVGSTEGGTDIANDIDVGNVLIFRPTPALAVDTPFYVTIIPYNENGESPPCKEEIFTVTMDAPTVSCENFAPLIRLPDRIGICNGELPTIISADVVASGYRWYIIHSASSETLLSETDVLTVNSLGRYRLEAYNEVDQAGVLSECGESKEFMVVLSEEATIIGVDITRDPRGIRISVNAAGNGDYEYALDNLDGAYQDNPVFEMVTSGEHTVYVRDKNGCGLAMRVVAQEISTRNFPRFFTPNGDGVNDHWQFMPYEFGGEINVRTIYIFNSYGNFIAQIDPKSIGWDGTFAGQLLPESDYWFKAISFNNREVKGHFALKR